MYKIDYEILIDGKKLMLLDKVTIKESVENLISTAEISLPSCVFNRPLSQIKSIFKGQEITIKLGYNDNLTNEFLGFISEVETNPNGMVIRCEDNMFRFRNAELKNEVLINPTVKKILETILPQVNPKIKLNCDYEFNYDKFTIDTATAIDVLKLIQEESHCCIYMDGNVLQVHPIYSKIFGTAKYDLSKNVDRSGFSMIYKSQDDRKLKVTAKGKDKNGKQIEKIAGEGGGDSETFDYKGIATEEQLQTIANEMYEKKSYTGFDGSFQSWLLPVCKRGYTAEIIDQTEPEHNGKYFVVSVETSVSSSGGVRKIELGKKL